MEKPYKIIDLEQGTPEWLEFRKTHITATDCGKILGKSKWGTALDVYNDKINDRKVFQSYAMKRGLELEPLARDFINKKYKANFEPMVLESIETPYMMASLDGLDEKLDYVFEAKSPMEKGMKKALEGEYNEEYTWQCQKQMLVSGKKKALLFFWFNEFVNKEIWIDRDEKMIEDIKFFEDFFYKNYLLPKAPPPSNKKDLEIITDDNVLFLAEDLEKIISDISYKREGLKDLEDKKDMLESQIKEVIGKKDCIFENTNLKHIIVGRSTGVDYKRLCADKNIDIKELDNYKKPKTFYSKFSLI